jgi:hypothetical protein
MSLFQIKGQNSKLTFEIFNQNVHNCLVDLGASSNVIALFYFYKIECNTNKVFNKHYLS